MIVIGGGPAGSSAAAIAAEAGRRVVVLEKEAFPRYKVGESLIPYCWFALERLGLVDRVAEASCVVPKHSVQFVGPDGGDATPFYFSQHTDHPCARTWQVVRSDFDRILLDNARERGAEVRFETAARELVEHDGAIVGVRAMGPDGDLLELRAPLTIDASGRDMFAGSRQGWRVPDEKLRKIAIWTYFRGAKRACGIDEGATTVAYLPEKGWFWYIPLPDDVVSVGVVAERDYLYRGPRDPEAIMQREIDSQPWVREHLAGAEKIQRCQVTGDYSYRSRYCAADGLLLAGDAFGFLDPVFSSGVFLALHSGVMAGDAAVDALAADDFSAGRFAAYGEQFCQGIEAMRRLVHAFYDHTFSFGTFMRENPGLRGALTDCLIGNVYEDLEPLFEAVGRYADIPAPLTHGGPAGG